NMASGPDADVKDAAFRCARDALAIRTEPPVAHREIDERRQDPFLIEAHRRFPRARCRGHPAQRVWLTCAGLIPACGDIDSYAHAPCQSKTPISHWTAGRFCDGCLGGGAGSMSQGLRVLVLLSLEVSNNARAKTDSHPLSRGNLFNGGAVRRQRR